MYYHIFNRLSKIFNADIVENLEDKSIPMNSYIEHVITLITLKSIFTVNLRESFR